MAALRPIPNLTIASPMDEHELRRLMYTAQKPGMGTFVIRYPRGRGHLVDWQCPLDEVAVGTGRVIREGSDVAVISIGPMGYDVESAIRQIEDEDPSRKNCVAHYDLRFLKPLDDHLLDEIGSKFKHVITVEDGVRNGGMGSAVLEWMSDHGYHPEVVRLGLPDCFVEHGTVAQLREKWGLDVPTIKKTIEESLK